MIRKSHMSRTKKEKPKKKAKCAACRGEFEKERPWQKVCGVECAANYVAIQNDKAARKADRAASIQAKECDVKLQLKLTEKVINEYVRYRDYYEGCCSCEKPSHWDGRWHASHYKSVGSNSLLRFHLWNIHKGCSQCNTNRSGNIAEYTEWLKLKFGEERIQWLQDRKNGTKTYTAEYLIRMRQIFSKKTKRRKKQLGLTK